MKISEEARWIQRRVYAVTIPTLLAQGNKIEDAINKALHYSAQAAMAFERNFPSAPIVDTTVRDPSNDAIDSRHSGGTASPDRAPMTGSKFQPGIENYQPPPKATST